MVTSVPSEIAAAVDRRVQPTYGYYRQPNGWITVSPITRLERVKYEEEGWKSLAQYGAFDMTTYGANHPLEALFMFGGAHELIVEQIIETGLYIDPPLVPTCRQHLTQFHRGHTQSCWRGAKPVEFPQLNNVPKDKLGPFPCGFCPRNLPTDVARIQHQQVAHSKELGNLQTGQSLGSSLASALSTIQAPAATAPAAEPNYKAMAERLAVLETRDAKARENRRKYQKKRTAKGRG